MPGGGGVNSLPRKAGVAAVVSMMLLCNLISKPDKHAVLLLNEFLAAYICRRWHGAIVCKSHCRVWSAALHGPCPV